MVIYFLILVLIVYLLTAKSSKEEAYENPQEETSEETPKVFCNYYSDKEDKVIYGEVEPEKCQIPPLTF